MPADEHAVDILSTMPVWVQVAANIGVFAVAAFAAAYGFIRKRVGSFVASGPFTGHEDLVEVTDHLKAVLAILVTTSDTQKAILALLQSRDREDNIEREVQRRLNEQIAARARA